MQWKTASLTPEILHVVRDKGTEQPFTGKLNDVAQAGTYLCRQCGLPLYRSPTKFPSGCGWPAFDDEIKEAVSRRLDPDGHRTEILCARCHAHLGHVFSGEQLTAKNLRHCVNSYSLDFVTDTTVEDTEEALFAAGCFWGVEFLLQKLPGVLKTEVGYSGGKKSHPTYQEVCAGGTGHVEAIRVIYDSSKMDYATLVKYFFEIHDPTQQNGQGPDLGEQYLSVIFYYNDHQKKIAEKIIQQLTEKNYQLATRLMPASTFWSAEEYHQEYYKKTGKTPYCHFYTKRF